MSQVAPEPIAPNKVASPPSKPMIAQLTQVSKGYAGQHHCLDQVSFTLQSGDFVFLTGPSGSGKSTLLKLLYGAERPDSGSVSVVGQDVQSLGGRQLALLRRRLGIIFQDYKLLGDRTVAENVAFVLQVRGEAPSDIMSRVKSALKLVRLADKTDMRPPSLSGGEQQRVSIARAIVGGPLLLLADEPTGNLDRQNAIQVLRILHELNQRGLTVLVTTHDLELTRLFKHRVLQLDQGKLRPLATH
ncbi:cell division ATP-binding protein FtsE [Candidatus Synechococcus calcipolaris G9]|uniref:Cell division ATP-binding protein FtsE n=1 Tax=Candidatus Synechococcus calcipolaris G9 TaxID=1497997 RepID=A0ABT6F384_9SYNE|nr:cell division ATP-binding protein FtsE [Candidatus Synechococcus calcipolaris]MDG2992299.1 cell division ATP-binding protein FtsE [Candidatus Synechococcus calcipolaris G9]